MTILFDTKNHAGIITLNRPEALNSLSHEMILSLRHHLLKWREDPKVKCVILKSTSEKALCAGGDVKELYDLFQAGQHAKLEKFFQDVYGLSKLIYHYPKPYISLIHGIDMGGGMGISAHGTFRIVSEKALMAMPEVHIGLFPDAAAAYFFCQCPGNLGLFLALTGYYMNAADALYAGIATHYVPKENFDLLVNAIINIDDSTHVVEALPELIDLFSSGVPPITSSLEENRERIESIFGQELDVIMDETLLAKDKWLKTIGTTLQKACPLSLKVTFEMIKRSYSKSFDAILQQDFDLAQHFMKGPDFYEGIRALLIEKDMAPRWHYDSTEKVPTQLIKDIFSK